MLNKQQQQKNCGAPGISKNPKVLSGTNNGSFVEFSSFPTFATYGKDLTQKCLRPNLFLILFLTNNISSVSVQFSSVTQSCPTLCNPMNCSTPGLPVHSNSRSYHQLPGSTQTHVHRVGDAIQPLIPFSSCPQSLPASGSFQMSQLFPSGGQSIGVSALASVLPMNTQD